MVWEELKHLKITFPDSGYRLALTLKIETVNGMPVTSDLFLYLKQSELPANGNRKF
jgi:hypothetical protein